MADQDIATTLGETAGDTVTMNLGYLVGTAISATPRLSSSRSKPLPNVPTVHVQGHDRRLDHRRYDDGLLRRPLAGSAYTTGSGLLLPA